MPRRSSATPEFRAAGEAAQRAAITLLTNQVLAGSEAPVLPLSRGIKVYLEGVDAEVAGAYATVVATADEADIAIVRVGAPFEQRATFFENFFHAGSLDFTQEKVDELRALAATVPTIVDVFLDRPAILTPFVNDVAAIVGDFGASSAAVLDVLFGEASPQGSLPMELPSSMDAVRASREDVPFDTADPLFPFGHGLRY